MTRSELMRSALRQYLETQELDEAIRAAEMEICAGKARALPVGGLVSITVGDHSIYQ